MEGMVMKTNLTTVPVGVSWLISKLVARQQKHQAEADANTIDNLERLHQLKEKGVLTNEEFEELKDRMKAKI
jgi:multidrug resistance efflux pump